MILDDDSNRTILPRPRRPQRPAHAIDLRDQPVHVEDRRRNGPPSGAPNVVVVLVDDMGFGAPSTFGGPCRMPAADRLAENGIRYTRLHTAGVCASTRAALLTGRNHHSVGAGFLVDAPVDRPGYDWRHPSTAATIARILALNGYGTGAFGKMHETPPTEVTSVGPFDRWPTAEGFEKFYGFVGGIMNHWNPQLFEGTTRLEPQTTTYEGYHLSEDLVSQATNWVRDLRTLRPEDRFFCYLSFGATHTPLHVSREWIEKYRGEFDHGWDRQRELTLERQKEIGVVPENTRLAPWPDVVPSWEQLSPNERRAASALMEVYAGFAEHMDAQVGRFVDSLDEMGVLDDTLIFYILGDNGASAEGGILGMDNLYANVNVGPSSPEDILEKLDSLGGPDTWPHYPAGWALAMDTPYQWVKQVVSHYGGTRNGLVVHWPGGIATKGEIRNQWHHVIDIAPTILEAAGLPQPILVDGVKQDFIEGVAMNYSFDDSDAPDRHTTQYFEIFGNRGIYHEGWVACAPHRTKTWEPAAPANPLREDVWELYDTTRDWSQAEDIADRYPDRLEFLKDLFLIEAARHNVFPIDDRYFGRYQETLAAVGGGAPRSMTFHGRTRALPQLVVPLVLNTSHTVTARIEVRSEGARGVICAQGGRFSGWAIYCNDGILTYCHNPGVRPYFYLRAESALSAGIHDVQYQFEYDGGGYGKGGSGSLWINGTKAAEGRVEVTAKFAFPLGDGFDVGVDLYTTVTEDIPVGENEFTGTIKWVRVEAGDGLEIDEGSRERIAQVTQ